MKYLLATILLLTLLCTRGRAQDRWAELEMNPDRNTVIALGGLNLRAAPGTHGKVLAKLPYRTRVEVLEPTLSNPDSINEFSQWLQPNGWARARAGRDTGYLYDAYLYYGAPAFTLNGNEDFPEGINTKYQLISSYGLDVGAYDPFAYRWHGLFPGEGNSSLRRVRPSFRYFPGEIEEGIKMLVDGKEQPTFFIGGPQAWPTGKLAGHTYFAIGTAEDHRRASEAACAANGITVEPGTRNTWASSNEFTLKVGDREQYLNPGGRAGSALYVEAATDLDGDGKTDFIISYDIVGWDMSIMYVLFLSSEARPGELVRPVAMHYTYSGC